MLVFGDSLFLQVLEGSRRLVSQNTDECRNVYFPDTRK
ncbi:MAG: hypothetical protein WCP16_04790 [Pseudanabaena sp. ELA645]